MQKTVAATALLALVTLCAGPALAQQTPAPQPAATAQPPSTSPNQTATTATVHAAPAATADQVIADLNQTSVKTAQLAAMQNLTTNSVHIVKVQSIITPAVMPQLSAAIVRNQRQLASMRQALSTTHITATTDNSTITVAQFLADNKIDMTRVIALDVAASNITLFVQ